MVITQFFLECEILQAEFIEGIKTTHFMFNIFFPPENRDVMRYAENYGRSRPQITM